MKPDIYQKIEQDFEQELMIGIGEILALDAEAKGWISDWIIRSLIYLSHGDLARLNQLIELAKSDWRDLLVAAEYDSNYVRVRDFEKTFHELGLLK